MKDSINNSSTYFVHRKWCIHGKRTPSEGFMGGGGHNCDLERVMESAAVVVEADVSCSSLPHGAINKKTKKGCLFFFTGEHQGKVQRTQ